MGGKILAFPHIKWQALKNACHFLIMRELISGLIRQC
jgi:hypothetical protein